MLPPVRRTQLFRCEHLQARLPKEQ
jgi:hypothetical protein